MKRPISTVGVIVAILVAVVLTVVIIPGKINRALAASTPQTCASTHGPIKALCEKQDPTVQNCADDARSVTVLPAYFQNVLIGETDLRYSKTCNSYWIRTIAYGSAVKGTSNGPAINVEANITFPDMMQENNDNSTPELDGSLTTWTSMTYRQPPQSASGIYDLSNNTSIILQL